MATMRQAIAAVRRRFPEYVATFGLSREGGHIGTLGEDGAADERGRKSWWFEFRYYEDDGTLIEFGDGYVHADGSVEGLYGTYWDLSDYRFLSDLYSLHLAHPQAVPGAAFVWRRA
jgi:hypothetical protein